MKTKRKNRTHQVREEILKRISRLEPGDCLGTELELAQELKVSRNIFREAVNRLNGLGIIESRQNQGLIVKKPDISSIFEEILPFYAIDKMSILELVHMRFSLEMGAVMFAVEQAEEKDIQEFRKLADKYKKDSESGRAVHELFATDAEFHGLILKCAGNSFLQSIHEVLMRYFGKMVRNIKLPFDPPDFTVWEHLAVAEAIAKRDKESACSILKRHLLTLTENIKNL